jgi:hypothetical protein
MTAHPAVIAFAATSLAGLATGYAGPADDRPTRPNDATAESATTPAGPTTLAEPGVWLFAALAEALPFAAALAFDADALFWLAHLEPLSRAPAAGAPAPVVADRAASPGRPSNRPGGLAPPQGLVGLCADSAGR